MLDSYYVEVVVSGVDYDDEALIDRLCASAPVVHWGCVDGEVRAMAFVESDGPNSAARWLTRYVENDLPVDAQVVRVEQIEREHNDA